MRFGFWEIIAVVAIILLLFGARRLPDLARALGRSLSEFKKGRAEVLAPDKPEAQPDDKSPS